MSRLLGPVLVALLLLTATAAPALAADDPLAGEPALVPTGYYLWHGPGGFNLRTHGPGAAHHFRAVLTTDGRFVEVTPVRGELGDAVAVVGGGQRLIVDVTTFGGIDGARFRIVGGTWLHLDLGLDGQPIDPCRIYLGAAGAHPASNPFTLRR
jgi:hypothetical protein